MDIHDIPPIDRHEMVGLATTEYERLLSLLRTLDPEHWERPTVCDGWSVRDMVAHLLGAAEANASQLENTRQMLRGMRRARAAERPLIDGVNAVQIDDRATLGPDELMERLAEVAPRAIRGRHRTPAPMRWIRVPAPGKLISIGFLVDVVYTRDQWMHRLDLSQATDRDLQLTAEHDGRLVADIVRDWAAEHGEPVALELTGPAGGNYRQGTQAPELRLDAVEFCLAVSGRAPADGLLAVPVVF